MNVLVIYKPVSEHATAVEEFLRDFEKRTGHKLETVNPETSQGADLCRLYDIVEYPSVVARSDDSQLQNLWRGLPLPTINEVSYYV